MSDGQDWVSLAARYRPRRGGDAPSCRLYTRNILGAGAGPAIWLRPGTSDAAPLVVWSGWMGEQPASPDGSVEPDFRNWTGEGRRRLDAVIDAMLRDADGAGVQPPPAVWILPHHRHVLSDGPSCAAFVRAHEGAVAAGRLALLLDLQLLITPDMEARRDDHVARLVQSAIAMGRGVVAMAMTGADWATPPGRAADERLPASALRLERLPIEHPAVPPPRAQEFEMTTSPGSKPDGQIIALGLIVPQIEATLAMLDECLARCPDELWDGQTPRTVAKYPFWMVAYHVLCFLDCYLSPSSAAFVLRTEGEGGHPPLHPKGIRELEAEYPSRRFEREELRRYVRICMEKLRHVAAAETPGSLGATAEFEWLRMNRLEMYLYSLRHVAHHTGQLTAFLRRFGVETSWVRSGFADGLRA